MRVSKRRVKHLIRKRKSFHYRVRALQMQPIGYMVLLPFAWCLDILCMLLRWLRWILLIGMIGCLLAGGLFYLHGLPVITPYYDEAMELAENSKESDFHINEGTILYDDSGAVLANLYEDSFNTYLNYEEIPTYVVDAFVAIEDRSFWTNSGIDPKGLVRVGYRYVLTKGAEANGASTITQQLARGVYLSYEKSIPRKIKEIFLARELTQKYSKKKIMEYYVNTCNYGNGIYGIESAAQAYFSKSAGDLTLAETTYLCAIPNSPTYYNPLNDVNRPKDRQEKILSDMRTLGYISDEEYNEAIKQEIVLKQPEFVYRDYLSTYAIDDAVRYLMKLDGYQFQYKFDSMEAYQAYHEKYDTDFAYYKQKLYTGGYRITTSLNQDVYEQAQTIVNQELSEYDNSKTDDGVYQFQGAMTIVDNQTHKVVAVVGGRTSNDNTSQIYSLNRAYQAYRQPGSSMKPIVVYTPILERGYTANTIVENIDVTVARQPGVSAQSLHGTAMTLRSAVEQSKNGVAWKLFDEMGPKTGLSYLEQMQFSHLCPDDYNDASALGGLTYGVSTVEMAGAYEAIANNGTYYEPTCITSFKDKSGKELYQEADGKRVYEKDATIQMRDIAAGVLSVGTASNLNWSSSSDMTAFAKTGTTNNNKDIYFVGATPYYSVTVWAGYDMPKEMPGIYGASYTGSIWKKTMLYLIKDKTVKGFGS